MLNQCERNACHKMGHRDMLVARNRLCKFFASFLAEYCKTNACKPLMLCFEEFMVSFVLMYTDPEGTCVLDTKFIGQMSLCYKKSGPNDMSIGFIEFNASGVDLVQDHAAYDLTDAYLCPSYCDYVQSQTHSASTYMDPDGTGALRTKSLDAVFAEITESVVAMTPHKRRTVEIGVSLWSHDLAFDGERADAFVRRCTGLHEGSMSDNFPHYVKFGSRHGGGPPSHDDAVVPSHVAAYAVLFVSNVVYHVVLFVCLI